MKLGMLLIAATGLVAGGVSAFPLPCWADKLVESNMSKADYKDITKTESSEAGKDPASFVKTHDLSDTEATAAKDAGAAKILKGKDWKAKSPKERDKFIRDFRETAPFGISIAVEVPSGNVWAVPLSAAAKLVEDKVFRLWQDAEVEKLPAAVKRDPLSTQSDRHGTSIEHALEREEEEP